MVLQGEEVVLGGRWCWFDWFDPGINTRVGLFVFWAKTREWAWEVCGLGLDLVWYFIKGPVWCNFAQGPFL